MNISSPSFLILVLVLINTRYSGIQGDILRNTRYSGIQGDIEEYQIFRDTGGYRGITDIQGYRGILRNTRYSGIQGDIEE